MSFDIVFKPRAVKDLKALPVNIVQSILSKTEALRDNLAGDVKRLTQHTPEYRLRVNNYRVLFEVEHQTVVVYRVVHRKEAYR